MGATHGAAWGGGWENGRVWGKGHKASTPKEQGVTSTECQGTMAGRSQAYVHRQARSLCSCGKAGMWEESWGVKTGRWSPGQVDSWPGSEGPLSGSNSRWGVYGVKPVHRHSFGAG